MAIFRERIVFSGTEGELDIRTVKSVSIVRRPIPWLSLAFDNAIFLLFVVGGLTSYFTLDNAVTVPFILGGNALILLLLWRVRWVEIEYTDRADQTQGAYFTDGSSSGWARRLGGADALCEAIRSRMNLEMEGNRPGRQAPDLSPEGDEPDSAVAVSCEECGRANIFSAEKHGTVQHCSHCNAYIDV
jgi:hypothetical protein